MLDGVPAISSLVILERAVAVLDSDAWAKRSSAPKSNPWYTRQLLTKLITCAKDNTFGIWGLAR